MPQSRIKGFTNHDCGLNVSVAAVCLAVHIIYERVAFKRRPYFFNKSIQFPCGMFGNVSARSCQRLNISILAREENK